MNIKIKIIIVVGFFFFNLSFFENCRAAWSPPLGIPTPTWPSNLDLARPTFPSPWTSDQANFYFIQSSGCSDTGRTYGNPLAPRCTMPTSPVAGSRIVINGIISGTQLVSFSGTSEAPIWIMGYDDTSSASMPVLSGAWGIDGDYLIFDSLHWNASGLSDINMLHEGSYAMFRNCYFKNTYGDGYGAGIGSGGDHFIFYQSTVYDQGDWQAITDVDRHGVKVYGGSDQWFIDSTFYHNQGDGIQVGDANNTASEIQRIYIGRNTVYENLQSCLWTKNATDVIFSQNTCYGIDYSNGGDGQGIGGQYDPVRVWFLANKIYNTKAGIKMSGASDGDGGPWYAIGNLIYNVESDQYACSNYGAGALAYRNAGGFTAIYNTVYNSDMFVAIPFGAGGSIRVANNIFSLKDSSSNDCTAFSVDPSWTHDYNLVSDGSWIIDAHEYTESASATFINPGINFSLKNSSLAVGNANSIEEQVFGDFQSRYGIDIKKDILGVLRPQDSSWDIGAYEYSSTGADVTAPVNPTGLNVL